MQVTHFNRYGEADLVILPVAKPYVARAAEPRRSFCKHFYYIGEICFDSLLLPFIAIQKAAIWRTPHQTEAAGDARQQQLAATKALKYCTIADSSWSSPVIVRQIMCFEAYFTPTQI